MSGARNLRLIGFALAVALTLTLAAAALAPVQLSVAQVGNAAQLSQATQAKANGPRAVDKIARVGQVSVDVLGLHSNRGRVLAAVYCSATGFPTQVKRACAQKLGKIANKRVRLLFEAVPAGEFALSLFHDENSNATLDTNWMGIPSEGWTTSRDAKAHFGPPSYADARLKLAPGEHKRLVVHMQY